MNRALLNPFVSADLPKGIEEILDQDKATCVSFNRHGNLLAVGRGNGQVTLWDFDTRSIAATLKTSRDEGLSVSAVSFPAPCNGSLVLVSYAPGTVRLFDTLSEELLSELVFDVPIVLAEAHPKRAGVAVIIPQHSHPLLFHIRRGVYEVKGHMFQSVRDPLIVLEAPARQEQHGCLTAGKKKFDAPKRPKNSFGNKIFGSVSDAADCMKFSVMCAKEEFDGVGVCKETSGSRKKSPFCIAFTRAGNHVLRGGPSGLIRTFALEAKDGVPVAVHKAVVCVPGRAAVRAIILSRKPEKVLVNSHDRCMRLFMRTTVMNMDGLDAGKPRNGADGVRTIEALTTFTEIVNKTQCRCACFSSDGDFVLGGMEGTEHKIHIWRASDGHLELTLEGAREGVGQIRWHPLRGVIVSVGMGEGQVYVWAKNVTENWSAFATEFSELEANEEYSESETEFDKKEPEDEMEVLKQRAAAEAADVDVETCGGGEWFASDSEPEDTFFYIPAVPVPDTDDHPPSVVDALIRAKMQEPLEEEDEERRGRKQSVEPIDGRGEARGRKRSAERRRGRGAKRTKAGRRREGNGVGRDNEIDERSKGDVPVVDLDGEDGSDDVVVVDDAEKVY